MRQTQQAEERPREVSIVLMRETVIFSGCLSFSNSPPRFPQFCVIPSKLDDMRAVDTFYLSKFQASADHHHSLTQTLSSGSEPISRFALAAVASWHVQTGCILLAHGSILTLINI